MARDIFQTTIVRRHPDSGLLEPLADVDVFLFAPGSEDPASAQMFQSGDSANNAQYANPITTGPNGLVEFYANVGEYDVMYSDPLGRIAEKRFRWNSLPAADNSIPNDILQAVGKDALATLVQEMLWDVGDIKPTAVNYVAGVNEPSGWRVCNGQVIPRAGIGAALFAKIGTLYGVGDNATTFNLPDYQGRVLVGRGSHFEVDAISKNDNLTADFRKLKHRHTKGSLGVSVAGFTSSNGSTQDPSTAYRGNAATSQASQGSSVSISGDVGDISGPLDGPAFHVVNYLIKL